MKLKLAGTFLIGSSLSANDLQLGRFYALNRCENWLNNNRRNKRKRAFYVQPLLLFVDCGALKAEFYDFPDTRDCFFFFSFFSELCWGKTMVAYTMPLQRKKEESERLRGERDQIKFIDLGYERFRKARGRQDVP